MCGILLPLSFKEPHDWQKNVELIDGAAWKSGHRVQCLLRDLTAKVFQERDQRVDILIGVQPASTRIDITICGIDARTTPIEERHRRLSSLFSSSVGQS
jgi:hypothetical protein